jgi:hypothetical protein
MIYEVDIFTTDDKGNVIRSTMTVKAVTKEDALDKYNKFAVKNSCVGMDSLNNVKEFNADIE